MAAARHLGDVGTVLAHHRVEQFAQAVPALWSRPIAHSVRVSSPPPTGDMTFPAGSSTTLGYPVTEFDALRADDAELAELRSAIRAFLVVRPGQARLAARRGLLAVQVGRRVQHPARRCRLRRPDHSRPSTAATGSAICTGTW